MAFDITSTPYHPASNGLVERAVQIVKKGLKKVTKGSISDRLANVLLSYRITPQGITGRAPSEMLLGRRPRTRLDLVKPHTAKRVEKKQRQQKSKHDATASVRTFQMGDHVWFKNFGSGEQWIPGNITGKVGNVTFSVQLNDGKIRRSHQDNLRHRQKPDVPKVAISQDRTEASLPVLPGVEEQPVDSTTRDLDSLEEVQVCPTTHVPPESGEALVSPERIDEARPSTEISAAATPSARKEYPSRIRKPPDRFEHEWN